MKNTIRLLLFFWALHLAGDLSGQRYFSFSSQQKMCENSEFKFSTLGIVPPVGMTSKWYSLEGVLLLGSEQNQIYVWNTPRSVVLYSDYNSKRYYDTLTVVPVPSPYFKLKSKDTSICPGNSYVFDYDTVSPGSTVVWEDYSGGRKYYYGDSFIVQSQESRSFKVVGSNPFCNSTHYVSLYVYGKADVDTQDIIMETWMPRAICGSCPLDLNDQITVYNADSIRIHSISWKLNGVLLTDSKVTLTANPFENYVGEVTLTAYKSNECATRTKRFERVSVSVEVSASDCKMSTYWNKSGVQMLEDERCVDYSIYIKNPQPSGFKITKTLISSRKSLPLVVKPDFSLSGSLIREYIYSAKEDDTLYVETQYIVDCGGVQTPKVQKDTLFFKAKPLDMAEWNRSATYCKGDTVRLKLDFSDLNNVEMDSLKILSHPQDFVEMTGFPSYSFSSKDTIFGTHYFDTIEVHAYFKHCGIFGDTLWKIPVTRGNQCYPGVYVHPACPGDTGELTVQESRLPNAYIRSIEWFVAPLSIIGDTLSGWGSPLWKSYTLKYVSYESYDTLRYKIVYCEGGVDTIIEGKETSRLSPCYPTLSNTTRPGLCAGDSNRLVIRMQNYTGRLRRVQWFTDSEVIVDSMYADIPSSGAQVASYYFTARTKQDQELRCRLEYNFGDSLRVYDCPPVMIYGDRCPPSLGQKSPTGYCDGELAELYVFPDHFSPDSIVQVVWDSVKDCPVVRDSLAAGGKLIFWRKVMRDTVFWATVTARDYFGDLVTYRLSLPIKVGPFPRIFAQNPVHVCKDEQVDIRDFINGPSMIVRLTQLPNNQYVISARPGTDSSYFTVKAQAAYLCASMNSNNILTDSLLLIRNVDPSLTVTPPPAFCINDSLLLEASFDMYGRIDWYKDNVLLHENVGFGDKVYDVVLGDAVYKAEFSNACGRLTESFSLLSKPAPTLVLSPDTAVCLRDTAWLLLKDVSIFDPTTVYWELPTGEQRQQVLLPYVMDSTGPQRIAIKAYGNNGCWGKSSIVVSSIPIPDIRIKNAQSTYDTTYCASISSAFSLTAEGGSSYQWLSPRQVAGQTGASVSIPTGLDTTTRFIVRGKNAQGCSDEARYYVTVIPDQALPASASARVCAGSPFSLALDSLEGMAYHWTLPTGANLAGRLLTIAKMTSGDEGKYTVSRSQYGCHDVKDFMLTMKEKPAVVLQSSNSPLCERTLLKLELVPLAEAAPEWQRPDGSLLNSWSLLLPEVQASDAGTYRCRVTKEACQDSIDVVVRVDRRSTPAIQLGKSFYCEGDTVAMTFRPAVADRYELKMGSRSLQLSTQAHLSVPTAQRSDSSKLRLIVNSLTCSDTAYLDLDVRYRPNPSPRISSQYCEGESLRVQVGVESGVDYRWYHQGQAVASEAQLFFDSLYPALNGYYVLNASFNACVSYPDSLLLKVYPLPVVAMIADTHLCKGDYIDIDVSRAGGSYRWSHNNSQDARVRITQGGHYSVTVTENLCTTAAAVDIEERPKPFFFLGEDTAICFGESHRLHIHVPDASYQWVGGSTDDYLDVDSAGYYYASATVNGCAWTDTFRLINNFCDRFEMPTAFRPSSTVGNHIFRANSKAKPDLLVFEMRIFDRWGNLVFFTQDVSEGWDGNVKGKPAPAGVYLYKITAHETRFMTDLSTRGSIVLIR